MEHKALIDLGACAEARAWASDYPTLRDAWLACDRVDWMLWLVACTLPRERLVWVTCQIARTALGYVPVEEERPRAAIESAEAWTRGEATLVKVARDAAAAASAARSAAAADALRIIRREIAWEEIEAALPA